MDLLSNKGFLDSVLNDNVDYVAFQEYAINKPYLTYPSVRTSR